MAMDSRIEELRSLLPQAMLADWVHLGSRLVRLLRDGHHPEKHDAVLSRLLDRARASVALRRARAARVIQPAYPPELPIAIRREEIVRAIRAHQVLIIAGETGSGKTTQLPKMCLEAGLGIEAKIGCTQPRRVAALSISRRIAEELNVDWGREVGCKIRFDDRSSPETYIKLMTDGILLAETQGDPLLSEYNAIIIDEAHERSLNIDFLLGYLKTLLVKRPELKLVITSATIDTQAFSQAFNHAPVLEVSGRVYPVEVVYAPFDVASEEAGEMTYIDAAVEAAGRILSAPDDGDLLVFMPSERDIRETSNLLKDRFASAAEVIPLFGRLSSGDQQRVFAPVANRKIVVATNIAETSLTIPGIRYVIDAGLARLSRYNARTRTRRLPIEPISQSSANQRKGRSGRVQNGVCIRLYSEADFAARPPFTQPEIQRANLAEVILRLKAFRLGEIETFEFINPPSPAAIQGGYKLLQELGALDENRDLTQLGRDLARLPIDPCLGRMLLQAQQEHATRELLIIAAGLSIQDPRERPLEQKDAAATAHKRFGDPRSDFLTLLNLWGAVHEEWEKLRTQNQRRKFCKANFLSYLRMREWQDLHAQLHDALEELGTLRINESNAAYEAVHRSILAGLLGHIAHRTERNLYQGAGNRQMTIFPGSVLYERGEKAKPGKAAGRSTPASRPSEQPEWVMAGEVVETSQLFARTVAGIDPLWVVQLAPHLCQVAWLNPHWNPVARQVLADEKTTLYGLEVRQRKVAYGNIAPKEATQIFIRSALVEEHLTPDPPEPEPEADEVGHHRRSRGYHRPQEKVAGRLVTGSQAVGKTTAAPTDYPFLEHNRRVRHKIETWQTRMRRHDLVDLDQAMADFYARHLQDVSSLDALNRVLRGHSEPGFLCVTEADLIGEQQLNYDAAAFPDNVAIGGLSVPLAYAYQPGAEHDGVTLQLEAAAAQGVSSAAVEWAVPGLREAQLTELFRALPKALRKQLMPFPPKVAEMLRDLQPAGPSLKADFARFVFQRYGVEIPPSVWPAEGIPQHLRPRVELVGPDRKSLAAGRDLNALREQLTQVKVAPPTEDPAWKPLLAKWEQFGLSSWTFGDLPERLVVNEQANPPTYAWPGLQVEEEHVHLRLFRSETAAREAHRQGFQRLVCRAMQKDLGWLQKDLRDLAKLQPLILGWCSPEELQAAAFKHLQAHLLAGFPGDIRTEAAFTPAVEQCRSRIGGLAQQLLQLLEPILRLRQEILRRIGPAPVAPAAGPKTLTDLRLLGSPTPAAAPRRLEFIASQLDELLPPAFLETVPFARLPQLPRYLKALLIRAERAALNPVKDRERTAQITPYLDALSKLRALKQTSPGTRQAIEEFRWIIEEFKVSLFAQELGTAFPVSAKRLDQHLDRLRQETAYL